MVVSPALAVRPLSSAVIALVAGDEGQYGYRDGSFTSALFNQPLGLAVSGDGNSLFVADAGNNRIRVIHLDQNNEVTTLAGQSAPGKLDGPVSLAQLNGPRGVVYLPGDRLVVNDYGNQEFRLVDLKAGTVTTLAGNSPQPPPQPGPTLSTTPAAGAKLTPTATPAPIPAKQAWLQGVQGMAYLPAADSIFYTLPDLGWLMRLDLKTGMVSTVLNNSSQIPNPAALWCQDDKIYVADRNLPEVFEMDWKGNAALVLSSVETPLDKVLSLSSNSDVLYGLLARPGIPAQRSITNGQLVTFPNPWGDTVPPDKLFPSGVFPIASWMGFVPDPTDKRKFYVARPDYNMVISFRDLFISGNVNSNGLTAPEYPAQKPKNTYRIIFAGSSRSIEVHDYPFDMDYHHQTSPPDKPIYPENLNPAPQMERELNFQAALCGIPRNYEVLNSERQGNLLFWPTFLLPDLVKRNDADLVVIFTPLGDFAPYYYYFQQALSPDGIPKFPGDSEYMLKPALERIPDGLPRKFYDLCKARGMVQLDTNRNQLQFNDEQLRASTDPQLHDMILEFYGKPLDILNRKLSSMRTSAGKPVRLLVLFTYSGRQWDQHHDFDLWIEAAKKFNFPYLDMTPEMDALHLSYFPLTRDGNHFDPDGCVFFGRLLANVLIRDELIPWAGDSQTGSVWPNVVSTPGAKP